MEYSLWEYNKFYEHRTTLRNWSVVDLPFVKKLESSLSYPFTVSELTNQIPAILNQQIGIVSVLGEISGYKTSSSGHCYFTLKDDQAQIDCVLWASRELSFLPCDGIKVVVTGKLTVYAPGVNINLIALT